MKTQPHPYDRRELKQVLHRNELSEEMVSLWEWAQAHVEFVFIGALLVAALAFGVRFWVNARRQKELAASLLLARAQETFAQASEASPTDAPALYAQAYLKYQALVDGYPGSLEERNAKLGMANADLAQGKAPAAQSLYLALDDSKPGDPISALAALGVARCLEAEGKAADARRAYSAVLASYPQSAVAAEAEAGEKRLASAAGAPMAEAVATPSAGAPGPRVP